MDNIDIQQLKRGTLEMILLSLICRHGCSYGYAILNKLDEMGEDCFGDPKSGTVYPVLYRLEEKKLIRALDTRDSGTQKRRYEVTDEGRAALESMTETWRHYIAVVDKFI